MTIRELAKIAKVSPASVSIVLNNKNGVSEKTRARVLKIAEENDYSINFRKNKKKIQDVLLLKFLGSGMLVEENQSFISTIIDAIGNELSQHNYRLTVYIENNSMEEVLKKVVFDNFCSVIIIGTEIPREWYKMFYKIPVPYVVVDNPVSGINCRSITMDNYSNVYLALEYLKEQGHKQIGYLRSSMTNENLDERTEAYRKWAKFLHFDVVDEAEFLLKPTLVGAYEDMCKHLEKAPKLPTCMYADNDTIALGVIKALKEHGYKIPDDVSIVAMDDIPFSSISSPTLTTVRVQKEKIGQIAVLQLLESANNPAYQNIKIRITGELIVRSSVINLQENNAP